MLAFFVLSMFWLNGMLNAKRREHGILANQLTSLGAEF